MHFATTYVTQQPKVQVK